MSRGKGKALTYQFVHAWMSVTVGVCADMLGIHQPCLVYMYGGLTSALLSKATKGRFRREKNQYSLQQKRKVATSS